MDETPDVVKDLFWYFNKEKKEEKEVIEEEKEEVNIYEEMLKCFNLKK